MEDEQTMIKNLAVGSLTALKEAGIARQKVNDLKIDLARITDEYLRLLSQISNEQNADKVHSIMRKVSDMIIISERIGRKEQCIDAERL